MRRTRYAAINVPPRVPELEQLPQPVAARIVDALGVIGDIARVQTCGHNVGELRFWCVAHPRSGFKCARCALLHVGRRAGHVSCLACGREAPAVIRPAVEATLSASLVDGQIFAGSLTLIGTGACWVCRTEADL